MAGPLRRGESAGERSSQTQRSSHQTEVLTDEVLSMLFEDPSLDVRTLFVVVRARISLKVRSPWERMVYQ